MLQQCGEFVPSPLNALFPDIVRASKGLQMLAKNALNVMQGTSIVHPTRVPGAPTLHLIVARSNIVVVAFDGARSGGSRQVSSSDCNDNCNDFRCFPKIKSINPAVIAPCFPFLFPFSCIAIGCNGLYCSKAIDAPRTCQPGGEH